LLALQKIKKKTGGVFARVNAMVLAQQKRFGYILDEMIIPRMKKSGIHFLNTEPIPEELEEQVREIFFNAVAGLLRPVYFEQVQSFFAENNQLYELVVLETPENKEVLAIVNIPTEVLPRFYKIKESKKIYIVFLDDIIRNNMQAIFPGKKIKSVFNIKITRDAELNLSDNYEEDIAVKIEKQLQKRDYGQASRVLYQPGIPERHWPEILAKFNLLKSSMVKGGVHHGLKDLAVFPVKDETMHYPVQKAISKKLSHPTLFDEITAQDVMVHTPYHHYNTVLRFFNEAAIDPMVEEIYTTLYRIASDSRIAYALISAAHNGKKVTVLVELKARFDEANNLHWSKRMKEAGVKIIYSSNNIKVHAKVALVQRNHPSHPYLGLLATGNLNEGTARYYTDHILLTAHNPLMAELKILFDFLVKKQKPDQGDKLNFSHLLVSQFNLQKRFLDLIEREITNTLAGLPSGITIKLNNLEEEKLINALYRASSAGVKIDMIVRGICCLKPGVPGISENIRVKRIVDRYLEHGRVFKFENGGNPEVFMGSSDWMIRNIYRRIEVCFPVYDESLKRQLMDILEIQFGDNEQAVWIDADGNNQPVLKEGKPVKSQEAVYRYLGGS
jgi:polyphosphate kinase